MTGEPEKGEPLTREPLTRERILAEALGIVDTGGIESLTMRRLARALGVVPTAIYWHVRGRDELLQGVLDLVMDRVAFALPVSGPWQERASELCRVIRNELVAHPEVFTIAERFPAQAIGPVLNAFAGIVEEAGYRGADAAAAVFMLQEYAIGSAYVHSHRTSEGDLHRAVLFDRSGRPAEVIRLLTLAQELDRDATFELGLKLLIDGLARRAGGLSPPSD